MSKILIIGSNSFSGSHMCKYLLDKGHIVYGISRSKLEKKYSPFDLADKKFNFYRCNLNKDLDKILKILRKNKPSIIINYASQGMVHESWKKPLDWYQTNIISQIALIEKIREFKFVKKFINFSTPEVYGDTKKMSNEEIYFNPTTPYAISRSTTDYHLNCLNKSFGFPSIITRTANVYGPYQRLYRIIPKSIMLMKNKKKIKIHGDGLSKRSFIYINDVCEALYKVIKNGKKGETYHISTNKFITIRELVKMINKILSPNNKRYEFVKDRVGKDQRYFLSSSKIRSKLGWKDKIKLKDGIMQTINWINNNYDLLKNEKLEYVHKK
jgi:dTDP-glucose 4,6-dehydratase